MEITIKNIGLIANAKITLNGLTVITGSNNSGKSTVGKVLYSCIEGVNDLEEKRAKDEITYYFDSLWEIQYILKLDNIVSYLDFDSMSPEEASFIQDINSSGRSFIFEKYTAQKKDTSVQKDFEAMIDDINNLSREFFVEHTKEIKNPLPKKYYSFLDKFEASKEKALKVATRRAQYFDRSNMLDYAAQSVLRTIQKEFKEQIYPLRSDEEEKYSFVELSSNGEIGTRFTIRNNNEIVNYSELLNRQFYQKAIFIDDPRVMDSIKDSIWDSADKSSTRDHTGNLRTLLFEPESDSIVEHWFNEQTYFNTVAKINEIVPGHLICRDGNYYYGENARKALRVENLATGSKLFAIVNTLLRKGYIDFNTVLIFDEPESHLHPEWQNLFAELIVMLVDEFDVNVLLTTHSSHMMLAIETYMRKYHLESKTSFYMTEFNDRGMVNYRQVNDQLHLIYADFVKYFTEMKIERAKYLDED